MTSSASSAAAAAIVVEILSVSIEEATADHAEAVGVTTLAPPALPSPSSSVTPPPLVASVAPTETMTSSLAPEGERTTHATALLPRPLPDSPMMRRRSKPLAVCPPPPAVSASPLSRVKSTKAPRDVEGHKVRPRSSVPPPSRSSVVSSSKRRVQRAGTMATTPSPEGDDAPKDTRGATAARAGRTIARRGAAATLSISPKGRAAAAAAAASSRPSSPPPSFPPTASSPLPLVDALLDAQPASEEADPSLPSWAAAIVQPSPPGVAMTEAGAAINVEEREGGPAERRAARRRVSRLSLPGRQRRTEGTRCTVVKEGRPAGNMRSSSSSTASSSSSSASPIGKMLRLLPGAAPVSESAIVAEAVAPSSEDGARDAIVPSFSTMAAAKAALAAGRADLLRDSPRSAIARGATGEAAKTPHATREVESKSGGRLGRPLTGIGAPALPTDLSEFLGVEAAAEAAVWQSSAAVGATITSSRPFRGSQPKQRRQPGTAPLTAATAPTAAAAAVVPPFTSSSPAAESAAVLQELSMMRQRLRGWGGHVNEATLREKKAHPPSTTTPPRGEGSCSPCDVSPSPSSSSTSSTSLLAGAAKCRAHRSRSGRTGTAGCYNDVEYWTTAPLTDIVEALEGRRTAPTHRRRRHSTTTTAKPPVFDPAAYARRLLDASPSSSVASSSAASAGDDEDDVEEIGDEDVDARAGHRRRPPEHSRRTSGEHVDVAAEVPQAASPALPDLSVGQLRREALLRSGPSWATAAAELGLTPNDVRELLRYSISSPEAAALRGVSSSLHHDCPPEEVPAPLAYPPQQDCRHHRTSRTRRAAAEEAAAQMDLVNRIVAALPAVPVELQDDLHRQRRLLERVCTEVSRIRAEAREAPRLSIAESPLTVAASAAVRQPSPVVLSTGGAPRVLPHGQQGSHRSTDGGPGNQQWREDVLPRDPAVQVFRALSGLRGTASDPAQPLPSFHSVVAPPLSRSPAASAAAAPTRQQQQHQQPYEAALHELAERETRHYVHELDRLRASYDQALQHERHQRQHEQQLYANLLQNQQQKMLRHHRETVHLLQRESRLQQHQQESLIEQLAASQAAAAQRQQSQHERTTKQMLVGAIDVIKSLSSPHDRRKEGEGEKIRVAAAPTTTTSPTATVTGASGTQEKRRRRRRRSSGPAKSDTALKADGEAAAVMVVAPSNISRDDAPPQRVGEFLLDADVPSAVHLSPTGPAIVTEGGEGKSAALSRASSRTSSRGSEELDGERRNRASTVQGRKAVTHAAEEQPLSRRAPANSIATLRAVYAVTPTTSRSTLLLPRGRRSGTDVLKRNAAAGSQGRMRFPLQAHLPPEEDQEEEREVDAHTPHRSRTASVASVVGRAPAANQVQALQRRGEAATAPPVHAASAPPLRAPAIKQGRQGRAVSASPALASGRLHRWTSDGRRYYHQRIASARGGGDAQEGPLPSLLRSSPDRPTKRISDTTSGDHHRRHSTARPSFSPSPSRAFDAEVVSLLSDGPSITPEAQRLLSSERGLHASAAAAARWMTSCEGLQGEETNSLTGVSAAAAAAAVTADKPSVGPSLLVFSEPTGGEPAAVAVSTERRGGGGVHIAPSSSSSADAQLQGALRQRVETIAELRQATLPAQELAQQQERSTGSVAAFARNALGDTRPVAAANRAQGDELSTATVIVQRAGALPPCDSNFLGAPAELQIGWDAELLSADGGLRTAPAAAAPLTFLTDYARSWARYTAAERAVEAHAQAVAAEDAGILEALASAPEHKRPQPTGEEDSGDGEVGGSGTGEERVSRATPRLASEAQLTSEAAAVRYREAELRRGSLSATVPSVFVSPRMAAEVQALSEARRHLSQLRETVSTPSASTTTTVAVGAREHALVHRLADAVAVTMLATQQASRNDPVQSVLSFVEEEVVRHLLAEHLALQHSGPTTGGKDATAASPSTTDNAAGAAVGHSQQSQQYPEADAEVAKALAELALEEAVEVALMRHREQRQQRQGSPPEAEMAAAQPRASPTVEVPSKAPQEKTENGPAEDHERVLVPLTDSVAWLRDDRSPEVHETAAVPQSTEAEGPLPPQQERGLVARGEETVERGEGAVATASATLALAELGHEPHCTASAVAPQELRLIIDLSPVVVRRLISPSTLLGATGRSEEHPLTEEPQQRRQRPLALPPVQEEQRPSPWLAQEDHRDVIVEVEGRAGRGAGGAMAPAQEGMLQAATLPEGTPVPAPSCPPSSSLPALLSPAIATDLPSTPPPAPSPFSGVVGAPSLSVVPPPPPPSLTPTEQHPLALAVTEQSPPSVVAEAAARHPAASTGVGVNGDAPSTIESASAPLQLPLLLLLQHMRNSVTDQEQQQRQNVRDREEEQRRALHILHEVAKDAVVQRASVTAISGQRVEQPALPTALAVPPGGVDGVTEKAKREGVPAPYDETAPRPSAFSPPQQPALQAGTCEAAAVPARSPAPPPLPPVRDPVMGFVLEWVRQYGQMRQPAPVRCITPTAEALVDALHAAARTAEAPVDTYTHSAVGATVSSPHHHHRLAQPYGSPRPSTRNLGSPTSTTTTTASSSDADVGLMFSLPSSLRTTSSSSASSAVVHSGWGVRNGKRQEVEALQSLQGPCPPSQQQRSTTTAGGLAEIVRVSPPHHNGAGKSRPVLETHRRSIGPVRDRSGRESSSTGSSTTRYTTNSHSVTQPMVATASSPSPPPPVEAPVFGVSSCDKVLPSRAYAEMEAALAMVLQSKLRQQQQQQMTLSSPASPATRQAPLDLSFAPAQANSSDKVTLPAHSMETTRTIMPAVAPDTARRTRGQQQTLQQQQQRSRSSPSSPPLSSAERRQGDSDARWAGMSLTSTSTSSRSGDGGGAGPGGVRLVSRHRPPQTSLS